MLQQGDYRVRAATEEDLDLLLFWRNSERVRSCMYTDHQITVQEHKDWFQRQRQGEFPAVLVFEYRGTPAGVTSFSQMDRANNRCFWGFYLGEAELAKGSASVMGLLAQQYIFSVHKFHKLCAEAFAVNEKSRRYHLRLGFLEEGYFVQHVCKNGRYEDIVRFGMLRDDWLAKREEITANVLAPLET